MSIWNANKAAYMQTNEKTHRGVGRASDDLTFDCFYRRALPCQTLRRPAKRRRAPITLLFVVLLGRSQTERSRKAAFILALTSLFAPRGMCSIRSFFSPSEKIWFTFFPLSPSLWRYSYLNINSHASSLAHTLSHIDICIWSLLLALHALLYCVSFNRCRIQYCSLCIPKNR